MLDCTNIDGEIFVDVISTILAFVDVGHLGNISGKKFTRIVIAWEAHYFGGILEGHSDSMSIQEWNTRCFQFCDQSQNKPNYSTGIPDASSSVINLKTKPNAYEQENNYIFPVKVKPICLGPWGGAGGSKWSTHNKIGDEGKLAGIVINYGERIDAIMFKVVQNDGSKTYTKQFGVNYCIKTYKIDIDYPHEYFKSISGYYGRLNPNDPVTLRSLTFVTNVTKYGPIGPEDGAYFTLPMEGGVITGFHGKCGGQLDSIGVYIMPIGNSIKLEKATTSETSVPRYSVGKEVVSAPGLGPWGGAGGRPFEDGVYSGIKKIYIRRDKDVVHSITIEYDKNGESVIKKHGGDGGDEMIYRIKLNYPTESLISISGFYGPFNGNEVIKSLSFHTTEGRYGPFGDEAGLYFSSTEVNAKVVGLHGRSGLYLDAIGVVREYC
ncbi:Jacalin-related lectin [Thalictrum thalictroides]|uniref:Jacalin-related lectin n=1 Tax=Thalictrum thalictroides TaxID=46969 RepID=A0A7J6WZD0_THATH|nr:Jacalin-related lectin [Thalictrum thalictroides]